MLLCVTSALAKGDIGNFLVAATPGGIEAQEARGQRDLVMVGFVLPPTIPPTLTGNHNEIEH